MISFFVVRIFKICSLSNFPVYNTVLLTLITMLHIRSPEHMHLITKSLYSLDFPNISVGKESACNAGDPGSIPGWGRSAGEGIVYILQNSWASLVAQLVKNPPAMWKTWLQSLGWEDPLEKGKPTHSIILV